MYIKKRRKNKPLLRHWQDKAETKHIDSEGRCTMCVATSPTYLLTQIINYEGEPEPRAETMLALVMPRRMSEE